MQSSSHIFISFKTEERHFAFQLREALIKLGYKIWWQEDLQCGQEWHGEIDKALTTAGAVVVLWSEKSDKSPWVRHEASQAIIKDVYAPVRIESVKIKSPYNRVQATDMMSWKGANDFKHPGFQNLLLRLNDLLPPPIPLGVKVRTFIKQQRSAIALLLFAIFAVYLLLKQSAVLNDQIEKQEEIVTDLQRLVHPLQGFTTTSYINLDSSTLGLNQYIQFLQDTLIDRSTKQLKKELPKGIQITQKENIELLPQEISIKESSGLWPSSQHSSRLLDVIKYFNIHLEFWKPEQFNSTVDHTKPASLLIKIYPYVSDKDGKNIISTSDILWNIKEGKIGIKFIDLPKERYWKSDGKIVSVIDLEKSVIKATIINNAPTRADLSNKIILQGRAGLTLNNLLIEYSGRELELHPQNMVEKVDELEMHNYTTSIPEVLKQF